MSTLAHSVRAQSAMVGKMQQQEPEVDAHTASPGRKQRTMNTGAQPVFSFLPNPVPQLMEWYHECLGWGFLPRLTQDRTSLTDMSRGLLDDSRSQQLDNIIHDKYLPRHLASQRGNMPRDSNPFTSQTQDSQRECSVTGADSQERGSQVKQNLEGCKISLLVIHCI